LAGKSTSIGMSEPLCIKKKDVRLNLQLFDCSYCRGNLPEGKQSWNVRNLNLTGCYLVHQATPEPPKNTRLETAIENHLTNLELLGRKPKTILQHKQHLNRLSKAKVPDEMNPTKTRTLNLFNSTETKLYILRMKRLKKADQDKPLSKGFLRKYIDIYASFCHSNQIPIDKPKIIYECPIPLIPTTEQVHDIINTSESKYTCIFTIMSEIAVEPEELYQVHRTQINVENGEISIIGTKQHSNGNYKLKQRTGDMLRQYLAKRPNLQQPFPKPKAMSEIWRLTRVRASKKLCKPDLLKIPLKNLRNYAGAQFYKTTGKHDPIATMRFMRHKKLETTLHYIRAINLDEPEEYKTVTVKLGEPDTLPKITELSNAGYTKFTEADGYQYFRIHA